MFEREKNLIYPNISQHTQQQQQQATIGHSGLHNLICSEIERESSDGVEMVFRVWSKVKQKDVAGPKGSSYWWDVPNRCGHYSLQLTSRLSEYYRLWAKEDVHFFPWSPPLTFSEDSIYSFACFSSHFSRTLSWNTWNWIRMRSIHRIVISAIAVFDIFIVNDQIHGEFR